MGRLAIAILTLLSISGCDAGGRARSVDELGRLPIQHFTERDLDAYLRWLHDAKPVLTDRVVFLARKTIGQPYKLGPLGEFPCELYDSDPLYCFSAGDCVTFVEQTFAMSMARDWPTFFQALQQIRYRAGVVGIRTRNHFTEADWNVNNAWLFEDITEKLTGPHLAVYDLRIDRKSFFTQFGVTVDAPVQDFKDRYVPRADLNAILGQLRDGDVVEFVRGGHAPYVGHMGLIVRDPAGGLNLIHAARPAVREVPLCDYINEHTNILGVKILRTIRS